MLDRLKDIAVAAGRRILEVYDSDFAVQAKDDRSPLTEADLAAHWEIIAGLRALTPDIPVLSEESANIPWSIRSTWTRYWLVDPLDGTREFVKRNGEFTVNIALVEDSRPVMAVVHVPVTGVSYSADAGSAWKDDRPIRTRIPAADPPVLVSSRSHAGDSLAAFLAALGPHELTSIGSSLKLCLVAEGVADFYPRLGPTSEWDTAAAQCVVESAGGRVTDVEGEPLRCNRKDSLLNPHFFVMGDPASTLPALARQTLRARPSVAGP